MARLRKIGVSTVGFVDAPANRRRFLLVKRKGEHTMDQVELDKLQEATHEKLQALQRLVERSGDSELLAAFDALQEALDGERDAYGYAAPEGKARGKGKPEDDYGEPNGKPQPKSPKMRELRKSYEGLIAKSAGPRPTWEQFFRQQLRDAPGLYEQLVAEGVELQ